MTHPALLNLSRRVGAFPIEWPAAAMLAGAVAFATLAMPDWRFERLVAMTGLANLTAAASPPLGTTARMLAALAFAGIAFVGAWSGLRALETHSLAGGFPAFRAADRHPDAPRRRPIRADSEFGTPVEASLEPMHERPLVASEPLPSFLAPQPVEYAEYELEPANLEPETVCVEPASPVAEWPPTEVPALLPLAPAQNVPLLRRKPTVVPRPEAEQDDVPDLIARLELKLSGKGMQAVPADIGEDARDEILDILGDLDRMRDAARA